MRGYRAYVERDLLRDITRLLVFQDRAGHVACLMEDGTWTEVAEGTKPAGEIGVPIPAHALPEIARAVNEHLGNSIPSQAEVSVLREWLAVERDRVDSFLLPGRSA